MQPLKLSDAELDAVLAAARPIAPDRRDEFLQAVVDALAGLSELGPGAVYRAIRTVQKQFFEPPDFAGPGIRRGGHGL
jgi:hypothetical protein